jgi:hypothetical protein
VSFRDIFVGCPNNSMCPENAGLFYPRGSGFPPHPSQFSSIHDFDSYKVSNPRRNSGRQRSRGVDQKAQFAAIRSVHRFGLPLVLPLRRIRVLCVTRAVRRTPDASAALRRGPRILSRELATRLERHIIQTGM